MDKNSLPYLTDLKLEAQFNVTTIFHWMVFRNTWNKSIDSVNKSGCCCWNDLFQNGSGRATIYTLYYVSVLVSRARFNSIMTPATAARSSRWSVVSDFRALHFRDNLMGRRRGDTHTHTQRVPDCWDPATVVRVRS